MICVIMLIEQVANQTAMILFLVLVYLKDSSFF